MKTEEKETGLAIYQAEVPAALFTSNLAEALPELRDALQGMTGLHKLVTLKCPTGGGLQWELPTVDGEMMAPTFEATIIKVFMGRKYWREAYGEGTPPDCQSSDTFTGSQFGECAQCPLNAFDPLKYVKACKQNRTVILLMEDSLMPYVLNVPVMSIQSLSKYAQRLASGGRSKDGGRVSPVPFYSVVTQFGLERAKAKAGANCSRMTFKGAGYHSPEHLAMVKQYREAILPHLEKMNDTSNVSKADMENGDYMSHPPPQREGD